MTVTQAVRAARHVLQKYIGEQWIEGEVSSLTRASSGHLYFALKDQRSQLQAVMWRADTRRLRFRMEMGQVLRCHGLMTMYERDGKFQLQVRYAEPAGMGAEALALEQLKRKLAQEGLFDQRRKRPLPRLPRRIGVVTSKSGAAVRDIIRTVHRRFPVPILVADAQVQGAAAPRELARAIGMLGRTDVDVIIVGRGGGSASDLAAFNEEIVVRAVAACPVPTISAVGHEVDISLCDLAADRRAATPTAAGELAVPVLDELAQLLDKEQRRLTREMMFRLQNARQELDQLTGASERILTTRLGRGRRALGDLHARLQTHHPRARLVAHRSELRALHGQLEALMSRRLRDAGQAFASLTARLESLSPLRVLQRGYALATSEQHVLTDATQVAPGDPVTVRLARGQLDCRVDAVRPGGEPDGKPESGPDSKPGSGPDSEPGQRGS